LKISCFDKNSNLHIYVANLFFNITFILMNAYIITLVFADKKWQE
jgi:hypothetical protein